MGLFDAALRERRGPVREDAEAPPDDVATTTQLASRREATTYADGEQVTIGPPETVQTDDDGNWLSEGGPYGRPRGTEALQSRQIVQTSTMQAIANGIASNISGGDLVFEAVEDVMDGLTPAEQERAERLKVAVRDVLEGPHLGDNGLDDLMNAAVEDMLGPGEAVWQLLPPADGSGVDLPVVALNLLDPLTVRKNVDKHGVPKEPAYWQASGAFSGGVTNGFGALDPTPLADDELVTLAYPLGTRSWNGPYPISPSWQVREWLEILANSTTHHNRHYNNNEIPPGLIQIVGASNNTITDVREKIEEASGDPRTAPIVGGEGGAQWIEMAGTSVNLNIIEEQKWFTSLCLGALGLGKAELGLIEDVNRANGEVEASRIYKRVTGPFINQFEQAFRHIAEQFAAYNELGRPFQPSISYTDPREEHAKEKRLREQLQVGAITPKQYARRVGDDDLAADDDEWSVTIAGEEIDYGEHPTWVTKRLMADAGEGINVDDDGAIAPEEDDDGE